MQRVITPGRRGATGGDGGRRGATGAQPAVLQPVHQQAPGKGPACRLRCTSAPCGPRCPPGTFRRSCRAQDGGCLELYLSVFHGGPPWTPKISGHDWVTPQQQESQALEGEWGPRQVGRFTLAPRGLGHWDLPARACPGGGGEGGGLRSGPRSRPPGSRLAGQRGLRATGVMP